MPATPSTCFARRPSCAAPALPHTGDHRGFTIIEMAIAMGVIAILAAIALPNIDFNRFRMDANARNVQNQLIAAQYTAVQRNRPVIVSFMYNQDQFRLVVDLNSDGIWNSSTETRQWRTLSEGAKFVRPPRTIDGASRYYATGPGLSYIDATGQSSTCNNCPTFTFFPNGSTSGDVVVYLGSKTSPRPEDNRAVQIYGATSKVHIWRMQPNGNWTESNL